MRWYVERSGKIRGPFAEDDVRALIANSKIDDSCRLRSTEEAVDNWRRLEEIPEFEVPWTVNSPKPPSDLDLSIAPAPPPFTDRATLNIERSEKVGRTLLWLALAGTIVLVPIGLAKERRTEAETLERIKDATRAAEQKLESLEKSIADKQPQRIMFASIGNGLTVLNTDNATGQLWFTNVSARAGHVCVVGEVTNPTSMKTESLPACAEVPPFASVVHLTVMFAGSDLNAVCKAGQCSLHMKDAN